MRRVWCGPGFDLTKMLAEKGQTRRTKKGGEARLTIANLANGDRNGGGDDLGLAVRDRLDNGCGDDLGGHNLAVVRLGHVGVAAVARHGNDLDSLALGSPVTIVQVVEVARLALVPNRRPAEGERLVPADGEASGVDGASLGRVVELELVVGRNVSCPALSIGEDAVGQGQEQGAVGAASGALHGLALHG